MAATTAQSSGVSISATSTWTPKHLTFSFFMINLQNHHWRYCRIEMVVPQISRITTLSAGACRPRPLPPPPFTKAAATETPCYRDQPLCRPCSAAQEERRFPCKHGPSVFLLARLPRGQPFAFTRQHGSEAAAPRWNRPKKSQAAPSFLNLHPLNPSITTFQRIRGDRGVSPRLRNPESSVLSPLTSGVQS